MITGDAACQDRGEGGADNGVLLRPGHDSRQCEWSVQSNITHSNVHRFDISLCVWGGGGDL